MNHSVTSGPVVFVGTPLANLYSGSILVTDVESNVATMPVVVFVDVDVDVDVDEVVAGFKLKLKLSI